MFYYDEGDGIKEGSPQLFLNLTGAEWVEEMKITSFEDLNTVFSPKVDELELMKFLLPAYQAYKKRAPKLTIRKGKGQGCHSVFAFELIKKGSVVAEYLGEWLPSGSGPSQYRWGPIDGARWRNIGGMVEDGFPNVSPFYLYNVDGIPLRVIFVAIEDIAEGDAIAINYGMSHSVKIFCHEEYRLDSMCTFFSKNSLTRLFKKIKEMRNRCPKELGWAKTLFLENMVVKLRYLYQTPSALMHILLSGIIEEDEMYRFYREAEVRYFFLGFPYQPNARQREVAAYIDLISSYFKRSAPGKQEVKETIDAIRQRILYRLMIKKLIEGGDATMLQAEALVWNDIFDAIKENCRPLFEFKLLQVRYREELLIESLCYAKEQGSLLTPWIESLMTPLVPLSPTG